MKHALSVIFVALLAPCSCEKPALKSTDPKPVQLHQRVPAGWAHDNFAKVIGYRFRIPGENEKGEAGDGYFTLCWDEKVNLDQLGQLATDEAELSPDQTTQLLNAVLGDADEVTHVACYNPHHIFVFYGTDGSAQRAIEVCFECNGVHAVGPSPEDQFQKYDLVSLAKLCDQLGLWHESMPADRYVPIFSEGWEDDR